MPPGKNAACTSVPPLCRVNVQYSENPPATIAAAPSPSAIADSVVTRDDLLFSSFGSAGNMLRSVDSWLDVSHAIAPTVIAPAANAPVAIQPPIARVERSAGSACTAGASRL